MMIELLNYIIEVTMLVVGIVVIAGVGVLCLFGMWALIRDAQDGKI